MLESDHQAPKLRQKRSRDLKLREGLRKKEAHEAQVRKDLLGGGENSQIQRLRTVQMINQSAQRVCSCWLSCWYLTLFHVAGA